MLSLADHRLNDRGVADLLDPPLSEDTVAALILVLQGAKSTNILRRFQFVKKEGGFSVVVCGVFLLNVD
jgi:hypothetical protein